MITGCSSSRFKGSELKNQQFFYSLNDKSGQYLVIKKLKYLEPKVITKLETYDPADRSKPLEVLVSLSQVHVMRKNYSKAVLLPLESEYKVWLEKSLHYSKLKVNPQKRSLMVTYKKDDKRVVEETHVIPSKRRLCFFSQLHECLKFYKVLDLKPTKKVDMTLIWDQYPFHLNFFENIGESPFAKIEIANLGKIGSSYRIGVLYLGQEIVIDLKPNYSLDQFAWIVQGYLKKPYEDI